MKNINISWAVFIVGIFFSLNNIFAQSSPPLIVFGLIADTQYADCESGKTRFYRNSLGKLHESIDYFNNQKVQYYEGRISNYEYCFLRNNWIGSG